ncbi:hypothetical protein SAMN06265348_109123 [Pedobacter westerhofensis]|uniref:Uncharacterized protein n=1 Tax=Pedobacter westerhofensis TaxID=425512 RepID=A0A521ETJ6_9SPHI|nr:hypothetical protein [Pedobacter westerhofensis]SMO87234.1 hypothetical protein SAMN06265348_109123 [Pedobacter westerhofensis]
MKTLFNQHQNYYPFYSCKKSADQRYSLEQIREKAITDHIKSMAKEKQQDQREELTDLMIIIYL